MADAAYRLSLFLLIFAPLAFGTVEPWSLAITELGCFLTLVLFLWAHRGDSGQPLYRVPGLAPLLCLVGFALLQCLPLPAAVVGLVSPNTLQLHAETVGLAAPAEWLTLSLHPKSTLAEFFRLGAYVSLYFVTVQWLATSKRLERAVGVMLVLAGLVAFLAVIQHLTFNGKIYWLRDLTRGGAPFGPFVNRNHYAGFIGMLLPPALALFLHYRPRVSYGSLRERVVEAFGGRSGNLSILLGFSSVLIATSVFLSLSRGGIVSLTLSTAFLGVCLAMRAGEERKGLSLAVMSVVILLSVGWFGWNPIFERFERFRDADGRIVELRFDIWEDARALAGDFPVTGIGLGAFEHIYPRYQTVTGNFTVVHAHNDYVELFAEGGVVGFGLSAWFVLAVIASAFRGLRKRREQYSVYLGLGCLAGLLSMLLHSVSDFNLHIAANGLWFFFLSGLVVSAAHTRRRGQQATYLPPGNVRPRRLCAPAIVLLAAAGVFSVGDLIGRVQSARIRASDSDDPATMDIREIDTLARKASVWDPLEPSHPWVRARVRMHAGDPEGALQYGLRGLKLAPASGMSLQRLGSIYAGMGDAQRADRFYRAGIQFAPTDPVLQRSYGAWLLARGEKELGRDAFRAGIELEPEKTREYVTLMLLAGLSDNEIAEALPQRVGPHLEFADYLLESGREGLAEQWYRKALGHVGNESLVLPSFFYRVSGFYRTLGRTDEALAVMLGARDALPRNVGVRLTLAGWYEEQGVVYRAAEEYEQALLLEPGNRRARRGLERLRGK